MDDFSNIVEDGPAAVLLTKKGEILDKKTDVKEIQRWIDSISTDGQEILNKTGSDADVQSKSFPRKKSGAKDDLVLGDEATPGNCRESTHRNFFQQLMRKKFSEGVTGGSFNSDATSDSFHMMLDSRQRSAELILRNLGFYVPAPCKEAERVIPDRFFKEPSAAIGICSSMSSKMAPNPSVVAEEGHSSVIDVMDRIMRLISTEKETDKNADNDSTYGEEDDNDDEIDGMKEDSENNLTARNVLLETIKELFLSKMSSLGACPTNASGSPPGVIRGGPQVVRPSLKVSQAGTRYLTILQVENSEYLDSIGYYDTMPNVEEPYQNSPLQDQFTNALTRLQLLGKKRRNTAKSGLVVNGEKAPAPGGPNAFSSSDGVTSRDAPSHDNEALEAHGGVKGGGDGDSARSPGVKMKNLPPRFLQTPSLLGNLPQFVPDSSPSARQEDPAASRGDFSSTLNQHHLHRQSSVFSDQPREQEEDANDEDDDRYQNRSGVMLRFSESSYSCGDSSCSSLPRDLELERYYASKNLLRTTTADSDDVDCLSDRTAVDENTTRIPSISEAAEVQPVEKSESALPDLSELKKKLKARMSRQTSSQSDSSGFGDSEFVDALTQFQSAGRSSRVGPPLKTTDDVGRTGAPDRGGSRKGEESQGATGEIHPEPRVAAKGSTAGLCQSCSGAREVLLLETWCQTPLSLVKSAGGRAAASATTSEGSKLSFRSELKIDKGGDRDLSVVPFRSEVCLFLRDQTSRPRASTTLNFKLSRLPPPDRRHSCDAWNPNAVNAGGQEPHLSYQLLSKDTERVVRSSFSPNPQTLPNCRSHYDDCGFNVSSYCTDSNETLPSFQQLCRLNPGERQVMMETASQLLCTALTFQEDVKQIQSGDDTTQSHASNDAFRSGTPVFYEEVLEQVDDIHRHLLEWCRKSLGDEREGGGDEELKELRDLAAQLHTVEKAIQVMKSGCRHEFASVPLVDVSSDARPRLLSGSVWERPKSAFRPSAIGYPHSDLEIIKHKLNTLEERVARQQDHQELTLRLLLKEFKDSIIEEFRELKNNTS